ncbi:MAG TPA: putative Ig domain-containing protein [Candidatus Limnocylindria bacterium]|nr:putative Ig domain-containing protein [Candidatus Limnocylindria bacterium]
MRQTLKSPHPRPTRRLRAVALTAVAATVAAGVAVLAPPASAAVSGQVWTVGLGSDGQLGSGSTANRTAFGVVSGLTDVAEIAGGREHVVARTNGGQVWAWGDVSKGAVGDGSAMSTAATDRRAPVQVLTGATGIGTGHYHSLAVLADGTVRSWGYNNYGQLGNGSTTGRSTPGVVTGLSGVASVFGGRDMSYALLTSGSLRAWGNNPNGELGDGTTTQRRTPVAVSGITSAIAVAGGRNHGLALLANGTIKAWGLNTYGQLGDGTTTNRTTPITVSGVTNAVAIGAGAEHSLAVLADGRVLSWGRGYRGALGSGSTSNRLVPGAVNGLPAITSVDAGRDHSLAVAADGRLFSWGFDDFGQLGDGLAANRLTPFQVPGITDAVEAGGGRGYSVILRASGGGNPDVTPPTAPGAPTATSTVSGRVDLAWAASTDDRATTLTYRVFRDGGASPAGTVISSSVGQVTWSDTGRTPGAVHTYTVEASDGTNTSARSGSSAPVTVAGGGGGGTTILTDSFSTFPSGFSSVVGLTSDATRFAPGDSAPSVRAQPNASVAVAYKDLPAAEPRVCSEAAFRLESATATLALMKLRAGTQSVARVSVTTARALTVRADVSGTVFSTTATLQLTTWTTLKLCATTGTGGAIELSVNGSPVGSWATSTGTAAITRVQLGDNDPKTAVYNLDALTVSR